jgi:hypothetical protein
MDQNTKKSEIEREWANRRLCPDGNCIGVIGSDGKCVECGVTIEIDEGNSVDLTENSLHSSSQEFENDPSESYQLENDLSIDSDWESRILCSDENCIGTIGPNGKCSECGNDFTS